MADEVEMVTRSADGNSWVDQIPGAVSTGYQAQNTSAQAARVGMDNSWVEGSVLQANPTYVNVMASGPIDDKGILVTIKSSKRLDVPGYKSKHAIALKPGSTSDKRTLELVDYSSIHYSPLHNCYLTKTENYRVLNWVIDCDVSSLNLHRLTLPGEEGSFAKTPSSPYGYTRYQDVVPWLYNSCPIKTHRFNYFSGTQAYASPGAMTFRNRNVVVYLRVVSTDGRDRARSWGHSALYLNSGRKVDYSGEFRSSISSMYHIGTSANKLVALLSDKSTIHVYSGNHPSGTPQQSFSLSPSIFAHIDVVDGNLVAAGVSGSELLYYRFEGISNRVLNSMRVPRGSHFTSGGALAGITHLGDQIITRQVYGVKTEIFLVRPNGLVKILESRVSDGGRQRVGGDLRACQGRLAYLYTTRRQSGYEAIVEIHAIDLFN